MDTASRERSWPLGKAAVVGMGLVGGSLAWAIQERRLTQELAVYDAKASVREAVRNTELGCLICTSAAEAAYGADLLILAVPVGALRQVLEEIGPVLSPGCVVMDTASVKTPVVGWFKELLPQRVTWIGSHPMAGREKSGFAAAHGRLFEGAVTILCPSDRADAPSLALVTNFWKRLGCRISILSPELHDRWVAQISHLPHLAAAALVASIEPEALTVAGTGFRDSTRIAASCAELWKEILLLNRQEVLRGLDRFLGELAAIRAALTSENFEELEKLLSEASRIRQSLEQVEGTPSAGQRPGKAVGPKEGRTGN
jgi:prephenate dehydrogenase